MKITLSVALASRPEKKRDRFIFMSRFFGIVVRMYFDAHAPPHIHVEYQGKKAVFDFGGYTLHGALGSRTAIRLVQEWIALHIDELHTDWELRRVLKEARLPGRTVRTLRLSPCIKNVGRLRPECPQFENALQRKRRSEKKNKNQKKSGTDLLLQGMAASSLADRLRARLTRRERHS